MGQRDAKETEGAKQTEYKPVENQKKYTQLNVNVQSSLQERRNVLAAIKLSNDLATKGQYVEATEELLTIVNSSALSDAERSFVAVNIENLKAQVDKTAPVFDSRTPEP